MTNEELVKEIQIGINVKNNMEHLYTNNINFIRFKIRHILKVTYVQEQEMEDLLQSAYFALDKAVKSFDFNKENNFLTYFSFHILNQLLRVDVKQSIYYEKLKPLRLDAKKSEYYENEENLVDTISDEDAGKVFEKIENDDYSKKLWKTVCELVDEKMYEVLERKHKKVMKRSEIISEMKLTLEQIRSLESRAYEILKRNRNFKPYINDYWESLAYKNVSIVSFRNTNVSSTEKAAFSKMSQETYNKASLLLSDIDNLLEYSSPKYE